MTDLASIAGSIAAPAATPTDPRYEWEECRRTIDRFDKLLVDLRKTAFGVITTIFSAAAILFAYTPTIGPLPVRVKVAIFIVICLLIVSTYLVDRVHQIWLEVAVTRAKELETLLGFQITQRISDRFRADHAGLIWAVLYSALVFAGWLIFAMSLNMKWLAGHHVTLFSAFVLTVGLIVLCTFFEEAVSRVKRELGIM